MPEFSLTRVADAHGRALDWDVLVDGAPIGRLHRGPQIGRNVTRSAFSSGVRHVDLWHATVAYTTLTADEKHAVARHITRDKTTGEHAADHLLAAYVKAGIALPEAA